MIIWVDGDSCHRRAMDVILGYAGGAGTDVVVVADREIPGIIEAGATIRLLTHGSGEVDDFIVKESSPGDLAVTRDFGLGLRLTEAGITVLNDKGRLWTAKALRERAVDAEIMKAMRAGGITKKRGRTYGDSDEAEFAASLASLIGSEITGPETPIEP